MGASYDVSGEVPEGCLGQLLATFSEGRAVILCIPSIAGRMKMICAAPQAHPGRMAQVNAQAKAQVNAQVISQGRPLRPK